MEGLNCLGCDEIGFDWTQLAKGGAKALEGVGDFLSAEDAQKAKQPPPPPPPAPKSSIGIGTIVLLGIGGLLGVGGIVALARR